MRFRRISVALISLSALAVTAFGVLDHAWAAPVLFRMGTLTSPAGAGTVAYSHGLGVVPEAILFWGQNQTAETVTRNARQFFGITDGTTSRSICYGSQDNLATSVADSGIGQGPILICSGAGATLMRADYVTASAGPSTFSLGWQTSTATALISFIAIGGSTNLKAEVVEWTTPANGVTKTVTTTFQPTVVLHFWGSSGLTGASSAAAGVYSVAGAGGGIGMGVVARGTNAAIGQWADSLFSDDNNPPGATHFSTNTAAVVMETTSVGTTTKVIQGVHSSFNATDFRLAFTPSISGVRVISLALQGMNSLTNVSIKPTSAAPVMQSVSTVFPPGFVLMSSTNRISTAAFTGGGGRYTIGGIGTAVTGGTAEFSTFVMDEECQGGCVMSSGRSNAWGEQKFSKAFVKQYDAIAPGANPLEAEADGALTATGFTLNWTTNDATQTGGCQPGGAPCTAAIEIRSLALGSANPTEVKLESFAAYTDEHGLAFRWRTGFEVENLGYYLHADRKGVRTQLTPNMIAGSALFAGARTPLTAGREYSYRLPGGDPGATQYWLEEVDVGGKRTWHGPVKASAAAPSQISTISAPLLKDLPRLREWTGPFDPSPGITVAPRRRQSLADTDRTAQWKLAGQAAVKVPIKHDGFYRIAMTDLIAAGIAPGTPPGRLRLHADGQELPLGIEADGVEFYATGADTPFSDTHPYWLVAADGDGRRWPLVAGSPSATPARSFPFVAVQKERSIYFAALANGDTENFFGPTVTKVAVEREFRVHHLAAGARAELQVSLQGVTIGLHQVAVQLNGKPLTTIEFSDRELHRANVSLPVGPGGLIEGDDVIAVASATPEDISLLERLQLTWDHTFTADGGLLRFTLEPDQQATVAGFSESGVRAFDVTDERQIRELIPAVSSGDDGFAATVSVGPDGGKRVLLLAQSGRFDTTASALASAASTWHGVDNGADLVVIAHHSLMESMRPLVELRRAQGKQVALVDVEDVYDEFNFGQKSPYAIRDFLLRARDAWTHPPHFVLLVGDATLDPRDHLAQGDFDLLPTKLVETTYLETASDDWFADFSSNGIPEMAIGRLPARSPAQTDIMVRKILASERPADSGNRVVILADVPDGQDDFEWGGRELSAAVTSPFKASTLMRSEINGAALKQALFAALDTGPVLVNYTGHGSPGTWRGLLDASDAPMLTNGDRPSIFVNMTCLNGFFQDVMAPSLAEAMISVPGGPAAVWASSGLSEFVAQNPANKVFLEAALSRGMTLGDAAIAAKTATLDEDIRRTWILFGDPTSSARRPVGSPRVSRGGGCSSELASSAAQRRAGLYAIAIVIVALGGRRSLRRRNRRSSARGHRDGSWPR
jgi:Peptidase family C25